MILVIHCTRQQVAFLSASVGKIYINKDGTMNIIVPKWVEIMWKYAKVHEYREIYRGGSRMITHHESYFPENTTFFKRIINKWLRSTSF